MSSSPVFFKRTGSLEKILLKDIYDNIEIVERKKNSWKEELLDNNKIKFLHPGSLAPLKRILDLADKLNSKTVLIEKEYVDSDYLNTFSSYYYRSFGEYPTKCIRIHFFDSKVNYRDLIDLSKKNNNYLGFCVIRPTRSFQTSRTVIKSPFHDGNKFYTLCRADFEVNLSGNKLSIKGMPFIQQDTNVNVCAHASMWMISLYMHVREKFPRFLPSKITEIATKSITHGPPREGLDTSQILSVLREMGFDPSLFPYDGDARFMAKIIYGYIESEIPVLLVLRVNREGHAVTAIGHDYIIQKPEKNWDSSIFWVKNFIIHDDAQGPYLKLSIFKKHKEKRDHSSYSIEKNVLGAIVPSLPRINMRIDDVLDHIESLRQNWEFLNDIFKLYNVPKKYFFSKKDFRGLIFRTYLIKSNDFKTNLPEKMDLFVKVLIRSTRFPKYIWVTEISTADLINKTESKDRKRVGEIIIDSTADRYAQLDSYLAIHLRGRLLLKNPKEGMRFTLYFNLDELPYEHLVREP